MTDKEVLQELTEQRKMFVGLMCELERGWWPFVFRNRLAKKISNILTSTKGFKESHRKAKAEERAWFEKEMKKCLREM